jgi:hypothetical protein
VLCFLEVLWPDFSFTDMCHAVWTYQISAGHARRGRRRFREAEAREGENKEVGDPNDTRSVFFARSRRAESPRRRGGDSRKKSSRAPRSPRRQISSRERTRTSQWPGWTSGRRPARGPARRSRSSPRGIGR